MRSMRWGIRMGFRTGIPVGIVVVWVSSIAPGFRVDQVFKENLDGDRTVELGIPGAIDDTHTAVAELSGNRIGAEIRTDREIHLRYLSPEIPVFQRTTFGTEHEPPRLER